MLRNPHPRSRPALIATALVTTLLSACQFDLTAVPVTPATPPSAADGAVHAQDAMVGVGGSDSRPAPWDGASGLPPRGVFDAGPRDAQAGRPGVTDIDAHLPPPVTSPVAAAPREAGVPEAGPGTPLEPEPNCATRVADAPSTPYALQLRELARRNEPTFQHRPLLVVAQNGGHRLWIFGRTSNAAAQSAEADLPLAAYDTSSVADLTLSPGLPLDFIVGASPLLTPLATEEPATADQPVSYEVSSFVPQLEPQRGGEVFFLKRVNTASAGVWLADLALDAAHATRRSTALFATGQPEYVHAALRGPQFVTLYRCDPVDAACTVARAPNGSEDRADAYEVRTRDAAGTWSWTRDLQAATPVITGVLTDLTVTYNPYLRQYLAVHVASPLAPTIVLQTAPAAEGPFTPFATVNVPAPALGFVTLAHEQRVLGDRCGKRVVISYFEPTEVVASIYATRGTAVVSYVELP